MVFGSFQAVLNNLQHQEGTHRTEMQELRKVGWIPYAQVSVCFRSISAGILTSRLFLKILLAFNSQDLIVNSPL